LSSIVRDWFPLRPDTATGSASRTFSWLVYAQVKLRFQLLQLEDLPDEFPYSRPLNVECIPGNGSKRDTSSSSSISPSTAASSQSPASSVTFDSSVTNSVHGTSTTSLRNPAKILGTVKTSASAASAAAGTATSKFFHDTMNKVRTTTTPKTVAQSNSTSNSKPKTFLAQLDDFF
jgi:hypothetical protein